MTLEEFADKFFSIVLIILVGTITIFLVTLTWFLLYKVWTMT